MKFTNVIICLSFILSTQSYFDSSVSQAQISKEDTEISDEDMDIIENLDFLENLDLFEEELEFLEDYSDIDQSEITGEDDE